MYTRHLQVSDAWIHWLVSGQDSPYRTTSGKSIWAPHVPVTPPLFWLFLSSVERRERRTHKVNIDPTHTCSLRHLHNWSHHALQIIWPQSWQKPKPIGSIIIKWLVLRMLLGNPSVGPHLRGLSILQNLPPFSVKLTVSYLQTLLYLFFFYLSQGERLFFFSYWT